MLKSSRHSALNESQNCTHKSMNLPISMTAERLASLDHSAWQVHLDAMQRLKNGESIIPLSLGDPDFNTPDYINVGLIEAIKRHRTHYASAGGEQRLKEELAKLETRLSGHTRSPRQFTIFQGATGAIHAVLNCIANPGDNVVTTEPKYLGYDPTCATVGVELKAVPMSPPRFELDADALLDAVDHRTVAILINTPSNPAGRVADPSDLRKLADECAKLNLWLISDEVYSLLWYEKKHVSLLNVAKSIDNTIVIDSLSKSHAMSGWRVGWTVSSEEFAAKLEDFALGAFFCGSPFIQDGATFALKHNTAQVERMVVQYKERRDYTLERINAIEGIDAESPDAGMFVMADVHEDSGPFACQLLQQTGVSVMPGTACGECTRNYVRIGLTKPVDILSQAWDRIENWFKQRNK